MEIQILYAYQDFIVSSFVGIFVGILIVVYGNGSTTSNTSDVSVNEVNSRAADVDTKLQCSNKKNKKTKKNKKSGEGDEPAKRMDSAVNSSTSAPAAARAADPSTYSSTNLSSSNDDEKELGDMDCKSGILYYYNKTSSSTDGDYNWVAACDKFFQFILFFVAIWALNNYYEGAVWSYIKQAFHTELEAIGVI